LIGDSWLIERTHCQLLTRISVQRVESAASSFGIDGRNMKKRLLLTALVIALCSPAMADEIQDQINLGLEAYRSKDYRLAIDELNYAVAQLQEKLNAENANLLPEPLEGWTASEVENASAAMAMMGGGTNMSRRYQRGAETIEITLMSGSPMVAGMLGMVNNPMMLSSSPDIKPYRYKRIKGMKKTTGDDIEVTLSVLGQIMYQVVARDSSDESIERYLDATDFSNIQQSLLN
jgi:hypothetical protein